MLLTKEVEVGVSSNMIKYYENLGYKIHRTKNKCGKLTVSRGTKIIIKIEDLSSNSNIMINVKCDKCGEILNIKWQNYKKYVKPNGCYYCNNCANKLYGNEKRRLTRLKNSQSFQQWCYNNLLKEDADNIILRWDYELNKCSPKDVSYSSMGFNKKGYWFKCLHYPEHHSELKSINGFTNGEIGCMLCNQCNSFGQYQIDTYETNNIATYWGNTNTISPFEIPHGSNKKVWIKCPNCGNEKFISPINFITQGLGCPKCSDGISYPEKIMYSVLQQLSGKFQTQLTKTSVKWCSNYRYDFYISKFNCIIETHGLQHYEETGRGRTLQEEQENDKLKKQLALKNGIKEENYIVIDCRKSELEWIKNNVLDSRLNDLFDLSKIDWNQCNKNALNSFVKEACELWDNTKNIIEISIKLKLNRNTIRRYLKQGAALNWCDYDVIQSKIQNNINHGKLNIERCSKKVYCLELNQIFLNASDVFNKLHINRACISACCRGEQKSAGKHPITGEKLHWIYYEKETNEILQTRRVA
jgi:hypothetical protein